MGLHEGLKLTPNTLVHVCRPLVGCEGEIHRFIGEVMSFPIPGEEQMVMVRRVPKHPGTIEEMPMTWIEGEVKKSDARCVSYAVVGGKGTFPIDMLRYDHAVPVNFEIVTGDRGPHARLLPGMGDELIVAKVGRNWTKARWSSFLWGLHELTVEPL